MPIDDDDTSGQPSTAATDNERSYSSTVDEKSAKRKSRTVHIDVYCTGSDDERSSTDSTEEERSTTATTVFENEDVKVTHSKAEEDNLPRGFKDDKAFLARTAERRCESFKNAPMRMPSLASSKGYESDDLLSSLYPSQFSSYSALKDFDSTPWSAASSTLALPSYVDDYDSAAATSSKDTFSDIDSIVNGGKRPNLASSCDSFEYADLSDRERIRKMDDTTTTTTRTTPTIWGNNRNDLREEVKRRDKGWRSPRIERKMNLLRNRKMREYLEKHEIGWSSDDTAAGSGDGESDDSGTIGWTFLSNKKEDGDDDKDDKEESYEIKVDEDIVRRDSTTIKGEVTNDNVLNRSESIRSSDILIQDDLTDSTTRSDLCSRINNTLRERIGPFGSKSPSPLPSKVPSRVTSPFMTSHGERTDHIVKASIFGSVVGAFRKPGHHVGPVKNPSCSCEHCRRYFEEDDDSRERSSCTFGELEKRSTSSNNDQQRNIIRPAPTSYRQ